MRNKKITITISIKKIVRITEDHGGYEAGECLLCDASGWLVEYRFGHPYGAKRDVVGADLQHTKSCPMNKVLLPPKRSQDGPKK